MTFTAPFGFVPLSNTIVQPEWLRPIDPARPASLPPLHDVPFEDGVSGTFVLEVTAETPIFTRGADNPTKPFQLGDRYAIPGTALRGALRNVIEVATFGRFERVNDHRYSLRDLTNNAREIYGQHMAAIVNRQPTPLVQAGWLRRREDADGAYPYEIEVADFAKIEYAHLRDLAADRGVRNFDPGKRQGAVEKYEAWGSASRDVTVDVQSLRPRDASMKSGYGKATPNRTGRSGVLVFTGQPSPYRPGGERRPGGGSAKHHDFVFMSVTNAERVPVSRRVFADFEFGHSSRGQQNNLQNAQEPNAEWEYWGKQMAQGHPVPVFFLMEGQKLRAFGLAMMFRLPYKKSIGETIAQVNKAHRDTTACLDFAEGLFGTVRVSADGTEVRGESIALKGRVGISHAIASGSPRPGAAVTAVLSGPKASYYPLYVEQPQGNRYATWMDESARPRGWKRYRPKHATWQPRPPVDGQGRPIDLEGVATTFHPLPEGTTFSAHVDVHNLKPEELGALLWALDFGGNETARHALGLARPLGYGRSRLMVREADVRDMQGAPVDLAACRQRFEAYMESQVPDWLQSPQVQELVALAQPASVNDTAYQYLGRGGAENEFVRAKKELWSLPYLTAAATQAVRRGKPGGGQSGPATVSSAPLPVEPPKPKPVRVLEGEAKALEDWFASDAIKAFSAREKRDAVDQDWVGRIRGLAGADERKACLEVIKRNISLDKKSKDWLEALPGRLGV